MPPDEGNSQALPPSPTGGVSGAASQLERIRAELARHEEERARLDAQFHIQLDEVKAAREKAEAAWAEDAEHPKRSEQKPTSRRQEHGALHGKFTSEQQVTEEFRQRSTELEKRLRETAGDMPLERIQAELARPIEERARLESELHVQLDVTTSAREKADAAQVEDAERIRRMEEELADLRRERDELHGKVAKEQQLAAEFKQRGDELENRLRETVTELEAIKATQARQAEEAVMDEATRCRRLEMNLVNLRNERNQIHDKFREEHRAGVKSIQRIKDLENRLQESTTELKLAKAELKKRP